MQFKATGRLADPNPFMPLPTDHGAGMTNPARKQLTDLEMEVLFLVMDGYSDEQIVERLMESHTVIHTVHRNLFFKMEVHNDAMLVREAFRRGYVW